MNPLLKYAVAGLLGYAAGPSVFAQTTLPSFTVAPKPQPGAFLSSRSVFSIFPKENLTPGASRFPWTPQPSSVLLLKKWSADDLPFFCRIEHRMGQRASLPVKFRLGSVEYVDWLEGKQDFPPLDCH